MNASPRSGRGERIACVVIVSAFVALGYGLWHAGAGLLPEADPTRWELGPGAVTLEMADLAGGLRLRPDTLDLWSYRGASPRIPAFGAGVIEVTARVPVDGVLLVRLGADGVGGPAQPVLPPPNGGPGLALGRAGGNPGLRPAFVTPGGAASRAVGSGAVAERGVAVIVDRSGDGRITGKGLTCTPAAAPAQSTFLLRIDANDGGLDIAIDGEPVARCTGAWTAGDVVFASGVRRIQLDSVAVTPRAVTPRGVTQRGTGASAIPFRDDFDGVARSPWFGLGIAAMFGGVAAVWMRRSQTLRGRSPLARVLLPLLTLPLWIPADLRGALDGLRLIAMPTCMAPLLFSGVPTIILLMLRAGATASTLRTATLRGLLPVAGVLVATLGIGLVGALEGASGARRIPADAPGWLILAALGVPVALLAHVNTHPFARRVGLSWGLCALLLGSAEAGVRRTTLDTTWSMTAGARRASEEFAELLQIRQYRSYPTAGFPVRPPAPNPALRRIVALGGSSTGGAYQMDDLAQFWPARLQDRLAGTDWEVVNQAVGGWNTLHIRLYLESQADRLDADIYAIYIGHNDLLALSDVPYSRLYTGWATPNAAVRAVSSALNGMRLYVGFKQLLFTLRGTRAGVAVPLPDAASNLSGILAVAKAHQARVLLVNEALNPDGLPMEPYGALLHSLAEPNSVAVLDAAAAFDAAGDPDLFLDDCHLSVPGHVRLAGWVHDALRGSGWL